jgi:hypothetical protein
VALRLEFAGQSAVVRVLAPSRGVGARTLYAYFDAPPGTPSASTPITFTEPGLKIHTRNSAVDPANRATAEAAFNAASDGVPGYGCTFVNAYTNVNNVGLFAPPSRNSDFGWFAEVFFEVTPAEAGLWEFRYGADFGRGGGLYVDDIALDEKWLTDLWWNFIWTNPSQILLTVPVRRRPAQAWLSRVPRKPCRTRSMALSDQDRSRARSS